MQVDRRKIDRQIQVMRKALKRLEHRPSTHPEFITQTQRRLAELIARKLESV